MEFTIANQNRQSVFRQKVTLINAYALINCFKLSNFYFASMKPIQLFLVLSEEEIYKYYLSQADFLILFT